MAFADDKFKFVEFYLMRSKLTAFLKSTEPYKECGIRQICLNIYPAKQKELLHFNSLTLDCKLTQSFYNKEYHFCLLVPFNFYLHICSIAQ